MIYGDESLAQCNEWVRVITVYFGRICRFHKCPLKMMMNIIHIFCNSGRTMLIAMHAFLYLASLL